MHEELSSIRLFTRLAPEDLAAIASYLEPHDAAAGEVVIREGRPDGRCFFIVSGSVRVTSAMLEPDAEEVLSFLREGEHFGEMALIDGRAPAASVIAEEPCRFHTISHADLRRLLAAEPPLGARLLWALLESFCARLRETNQSLSFARFLMKRPDIER
jgi:CRP-like cAMP-binding protein